MHTVKHATAATEQSACINSYSDHAHAATDSTGPADALWAASTDDGSEHFGRSEQQQRCCNYGFGHGDFSHYNFSSWIHSFPVFLLHDQLVVRPSRGHLRTHWSFTGKQDRRWWRPRCGWIDSWIPDACRLSSSIPSSRFAWCRCIDLGQSRDVWWEHLDYRGS